MALNGDEFGKALPLCQGVGLGQLIGKAVGDTDIPDFSRLYHPVQPIQNVVERCLIVPHVIDIQVDVVKSKVLQAGVHHLLDVLLPGSPRGDLLLGAGQELGGHHHILPPGKVPDRPAHILLTGAALVGDGSVEEVDPQLQSPPDDLPGVFLVQRPAVLAVLCVAEAHAPHADAGNRQIRIAEFCVLHIQLLTPGRCRSRHPPAPATRWRSPHRAPPRRCG